MALTFIDASSAILLHKADFFSPCAREFSLVMAPAVFEEITQRGYPGAEFFLKAETRRYFRVCRTGSVSSWPGHGEIGRLGRGERDTVELFRQYACAREPAFIIIDDRRGAMFCRRHDIPYINALLVPKLFWYSGRMTTEMFKKTTAHLLGLGRYSKAVVERAGELTRGDLDRFLPGQKDD